MSSADVAVLTAVITASATVAAALIGAWVVIRGRRQRADDTERQREADEERQREADEERQREAAKQIRSTSYSAVVDLKKVTKIATDWPTVPVNLDDWPQGLRNFANAVRSSSELLPRRIAELSGQLFDQLFSLWYEIKKVGRGREFLEGTAQENYLREARLQLEKKCDEVSTLREEIKALLLKST